MRRITLRLIAVAFAAAVVLPLLAEAGCFGRRFRRVIVVQQPQAFYQVGIGLRQTASEEAIARRTAQLVLELLRKAGNGGVQGLQLAEDVAVRGIISSRCLKCHSGAKLSGGLDLSKTLTDAVKMRAALRVVNRTMPPAEGGGPLSDSLAENFVTWSLRKK